MRELYYFALFSPESFHWLQIPICSCSPPQQPAMKKCGGLQPIRMENTKKVKVSIMSLLVLSISLGIKTMMDASLWQ